MAFSPFDIFRRNQKIFMSVIVIGVMFMLLLYPFVRVTYAIERHLARSD